MSEQIKITIVMHDEKPNVQKDGEPVGEMTLTQESAMTLMPVLLENGLMDGSFCGGRGDCGRCVVQFLKGAPFPTGLERNRLEPRELRQGYRLACVTRPKTDCTIKILKVEVAETPIVTESNLLSENIDLNSQGNGLSENQRSNVMKSNVGAEKDAEMPIKKSRVISETRASVIENAEIDKKTGLKKSSRYIIAVDLGTTTIAMQLRDADKGAVADTYCEMNPQRKYGTDVLARIQASVDGQGEELRRLVCGVILRGLGQFAENLQKESDGKILSDEPVTGGENILCMCIAGNTAMEHLLLGLEVLSLGRAPFLPMEKGLQKITPARLFAGIDGASESLRRVGSGTFPDFPVYIAPCISAFVGGDIVAGLYALGLIASEASGDRERPEKAGAVLFVDLGTNGEMALADGHRMVTTATAAGPAFEGDGTMIGTDRIALTAQLLKRGILDETGLLKEPYFTEGVRIEEGKEIPTAGNRKKSACYFRQEDVRALQMAKAAVRAGMEILWEEMGRPELERVILAGGFGYYLDVEAAIAIGLLPSYMRGRVQAAGNTSLAGAYELGRDLCGNRVAAVWLEERTAFAESMNLAETERFEELYLKYMNLGEN